MIPADLERKILEAKQKVISYTHDTSIHIPVEEQWLLSHFFPSYCATIWKFTPTMIRNVLCYYLEYIIGNVMCIMGNSYNVGM